MKKASENKIKKKVTKCPASYAVKINKTLINQDLKNRFYNSKKGIKKNTTNVQSVKYNLNTAEDCENDKKIEELTAMIRR